MLFWKKKSNFQLVQFSPYFLLQITYNFEVTIEVNIKFTFIFQ